MDVLRILRISLSSLRSDYDYGCFSFIVAKRLDHSDYALEYSEQIGTYLPRHSKKYVIAIFPFLSTSPVRSSLMRRCYVRLSA